MTHYQKPDLCRVLAALKSAQNRALGKDDFCRVLGKKHSTNTTHTTFPLFAECRHGKEEVLGIPYLCRVP